MKEQGHYPRKHRDDYQETSCLQELNEQRECLWDYGNDSGKVGDCRGNCGQSDPSRDGWDRIAACESYKLHRPRFRSDQ